MYSQSDRAGLLTLPLQLLGVQSDVSTLISFSGVDHVADTKALGYHLHYKCKYFQVLKLLS